MPFSTDLTISPVETIVLHLLADQVMYGYEIIKVINERTDGAFAWKEGTLYPCLHRLEGAGIIASEWKTGSFGKPRKYYMLTKKGQLIAKRRLAEWQSFSSAMNAALFAPAR